jgi:hypothetical protein
MLGTDFYYQITKGYIKSFGRLFNDISIDRVDSSNNLVTRIKVPIVYANKDKLLTRVMADPPIDKKAAIVLPIISFEMTGLRYDGSRKLQTMKKIAIESTNPNKAKFVFSAVPYDLSFSLYVYSKFLEDTTKIVEEILPIFTPGYTPTIRLVGPMDLKYDCPVITLGDVSIQDDYDGSFTDRRTMIWQLQFVVKGWYFGPVREKPIIKYSITNFFADVPDFDISDPVGTVTVQPGLTANGEPTSNAEISVDVNTIFSSDDYGFVKKVE